MGKSHVPPPAQPQIVSLFVLEAFNIPEYFQNLYLLIPISQCHPQFYIVIILRMHFISLIITLMFVIWVYCLVLCQLDTARVIRKEEASIEKMPT